MINTTEQEKKMIKNGLEAMYLQGYLSQDPKEKDFIKNILKKFNVKSKMLENNYLK